MMTYNGNFEEDIKKLGAKNALNGYFVPYNFMESIKDLMYSERKNLIDRFINIMKNNEKETLWDDDSSNEVMKVSIKEYKDACIEELLKLK